MILSNTKWRANQPNQRQRRVGMIIHRALSEVLIHEGYTATIREVVMTKDLRIADIYVFPQGDDEIKNKEKLKELKNNQSRIKQKLVPKLYLKYMPEMRFKLDENFSSAQRLNEILS
jgi:ribosome-binding factor A